jgi:hypothetical protein
MVAERWNFIVEVVEILCSEPMLSKRKLRKAQGRLAMPSISIPQGPHNSVPQYQVAESHLEQGQGLGTANKVRRSSCETNTEKLLKGPTVLNVSVGSEIHDEILNHRHTDTRR